MDQKPYSPRLFDPAQAERRRAFLINLLYTGTWIVIFVLVVRYLFLWMLPFVFAFLVAVMLQRPLRFLVQKTSVSRKVFSVVLVVAVMLLLAGIVAFCAWRVGLRIVDFFGNESNIQLLTDAVRQVTATAQGLLDHLSSMLSPEALESLNAALNNLSQSSISALSEFFGSAAAAVLSFTTTRLPMLLVSFIIWVIASIFLTIDYDTVMQFFLRQVPERHRELVEDTRALCGNTIFKLLRAYLLLMLITFVELWIGLSVLHLPHALPLAALIAVVDILPVLGVGTVLVPWALFALLTGDVALFIGLGILYIVITVIRNILEPRVVSSQIGLNPLVTLFVMYLGLRSVGLAGMLLFPVLLMVLKQLQDHGRLHLWK